MDSKTISKILVIALPTICMNAQTTSDSHAGELQWEIQNWQDNLLLLGKYHSRKAIMQRVIKNYDELNEELQDALDTIWSNDAGRLLLRSLCKETRLDDQRITILWNAYDKDDDTNLFDTINSTIYLSTLDFGTYIGYCNGDLTEIPHKLDAVLFHELCHSLHNLTGTGKGTSHNVVHTVYKFDTTDPICELTCKAWGDDEEIYAITGWHINSKGKLDFDYLNTNTYMILQALKNGLPSELVMQRVFHCSYELLQTEYRVAIDANLEKFPISPTKYIEG